VAIWLKLYAMYTFSTWPDSCHCTTLLKAGVLNFYLTLDLLQSNCSDLVSEWRGHTVTTTFLLRGHCQTCAGCPETIFMFQQDGTPAHQHATLSLSWSEREIRETRRRLSACVRVRGEHFEHKFWQFWAHLSWQLITLLKKPYSVYCVLIQSSDSSLQIIHFNVM